MATATKKARAAIHMHDDAACAQVEHRATDSDFV